MVLKARLPAEANVNIAVAATFSLLVAPGLAAGGWSTVFSLVFISLQLVWIRVNLRHARLRLDDERLVVNDYFKKRIVNTRDTLLFDSVVASRGIGHTRRMLSVQLRSGEQRVIRCVHDSPRSDRLVVIIAAMNRHLERHRAAGRTG